MTDLLKDLPSLPVMVAGVVGVLWVGGYHSIAVLALVAGAVIYVVELMLFPWMKCAGCQATGEQWSPLTQTFRTCKKCGGLRKQVRWGRRLWTKATDVNEARK